MTKTTVAIVDDHEAIRLGFQLTAVEAGFDLVASCSTVAELLEKCAGKMPQVVILDLSLADGSQPAENVRNLITAGSQVLIYSIADKKQAVRQALVEGAAALVTKNQNMAELIESIKLVAGGIQVNNAETVAAIDSDLEFRAKLSERELEVLRMYASGLTLKQVAFQLELSKYTVKEHIDRVRDKYAKIGRPAPGKSELLIRLIEDGLMGEDLI
jgi:two-component system uhpT operon response regulator UhpA